MWVQFGLLALASCLPSENFCITINMTRCLNDLQIFLAKPTWFSKLVQYPICIYSVSDAIHMNHDALPTRLKVQSYSKYLTTQTTSGRQPDNQQNLTLVMTRPKIISIPTALFPILIRCHTLCYRYNIADNYYYLSIQWSSFDIGSIGLVLNNMLYITNNMLGGGLLYYL